MVFNTLGEDADMEWVMIDSTIVRADQHAAGAKRGSKTKHEFGSWRSDGASFCSRGCYWDLPSS